MRLGGAARVDVMAILDFALTLQLHHARTLRVAHAALLMAADVVAVFGMATRIGATCVFATLGIRTMLRFAALDVAAKVRFAALLRFATLLGLAMLGLALVRLAAMVLLVALVVLVVVVLLVLARGRIRRHEAAWERKADGACEYRVAMDAHG